MASPFQLHLDSAAPAELQECACALPHELPPGRLVVEIPAAREDFRATLLEPGSGAISNAPRPFPELLDHDAALAAERQPLEDARAQR